MDISTSSRPVSPPPAGTLRLIYEDGHIRAIDPNGRKLRLRPESGTPVLAVNAKWKLLLDTQPEEGDVMIIGPHSWTFVTGTAGVGEIQIGANLAASMGAVRTAINATSDYTSGVFTDGESLISAVAYGFASEVYVNITATGSNSFVNVDTGVDATEASNGDQLYDGTTLYTATRDISKTDSSGWKTSVLEDL